MTEINSNTPNSRFSTRSIVNAGLIAAVVDAASGDYRDVGALSDVKIVVNQFLEAGLGDQHGDVNALFFSAWLNINIYPGLVGLCDYLYIFARSLAVERAVHAEIVGSLRNVVDTRDLLQKICEIFVKCHKT